MGMYDDFKCSANIGALTNVDCQTKDMDPFGGTMSFYWVDPAGILWTPDYTGCNSIEFDNGAPLRGRIKLVKTGKHGRFCRAYTTNYVTIYNYVTQPDGITDWIHCKLHFVMGELQDFSYINNHIEK